MTKLTEDRLTRAGHDVRRAVAALPDAAVPRRRRLGPVLAFAAAAAVVVAVVAVPALLRSGNDEATPGSTPAPAAAAPPVAVAVTATEADLGAVFPNALAPGGDGVLLMADGRGSNLPDPVLLTAGPDGAGWRTLTDTVGPQHMGHLAAAGDVVLALGAVDGTGTTAYRSADGGATWNEQPLPRPAGYTQIVAQQLLATEDGEFVAAGIGTSSTFDEGMALLVWRSPDGAAWTVEAILAEDAARRFVHGIAEVDGRLVVLARSGGVVAIEEGDPWVATDLQPVVAAQAGIDPGLQNVDFLGAGVVQNHLAAWWGFNNGLPEGEGRQAAAAITRRSGPGAWEARPLIGTAPALVTVVDGAVIGLGYEGPGDYFPPAETVLLASNQGVAWTVVDTYDQVYLGELLSTGPARLVAAGVRTTIHADGYTEAGDGVAVLLELPGDFSALLGDEPGG